MSSPWTKYRVYDLMHRTVVSGLIAFSALGTAYLGYKGLHYYLVIRPARKEILRKHAEEKMAIEQQEKETELERKSHDIAKELKA